MSELKIFIFDEPSEYKPGGVIRAKLPEGYCFKWDEALRCYQCQRIEEDEQQRP